MDILDTSKIKKPQIDKVVGMIEDIDEKCGHVRDAGEDYETAGVLPDANDRRDGRDSARDKLIEAVDELLELADELRAYRNGLVS